MTEGAPIPLDKKVAIREGQEFDLQKAAKRDGIVLPGGETFHLGAAAVVQIANQPVGIPVEAYQRSAGNKHEGRKARRQERDEAKAVRKQFSGFLEEASSEG